MMRINVFIFCVVCFFYLESCGRVKKTKTSSENSFKDSSYFENNDTASYSLCSLNIFQNIIESNSSFNLNQNEEEMVQFLLRKSLARYNKINGDNIDLVDYPYHSITALFNHKGEKEVWIYYSCKKLAGNIPIVLDGGKCYFQMKINISKKCYTDIIPNSDG